MRRCLTPRKKRNNHHMKLYEIKHDIEQLLISHFAEDGEFIGGDEEWDNFDHQLNMLETSYNEKVENTALYIKNLKAEAEALKAEKMAFAERQKQAERKIEWLTEYLTRNMHGSTFESPKVSIKWRKSTSAEITDESLIPEDYLVPQPPKIDKRGILADLRAGLDVPGAVLSENQNIQIR